MVAFYRTWLAQAAATAPTGYREEWDAAEKHFGPCCDPEEGAGCQKSVYQLELSARIEEIHGFPRNPP
jgi:hypothetical protein